MHVILEGVDGAGKTSIAKALAKATGMDYWNAFGRFDGQAKFDGANDGPIEDFAAADLIASTGLDVIQDRGWITAAVYDQKWWARLDEIFAFAEKVEPRDALLVLVLRPISLCRTERYGVPETVMIADRFEEAYTRLPWPRGRHDKMVIRNVGTVDAAVARITMRMNE